MKHTTPQLSKKEREAFTKQQLEYFFEMSNPSWGRVIKFSFIKGLATGFGVFLGGTIVVAIVLWLLGIIGHVPFLNDFTESAKESLNQSN